MAGVKSTYGTEYAFTVVWYHYAISSHSPPKGFWNIFRTINYSMFL